MKSSRLKNFVNSKAGLAAGIALGLVGTAVWVESRARRAEREHPPEGRFIDIDGVRLHYVERGSGTPVVLLHGNTVTHNDFKASGLFERLAATHRVIAFDRPGFGHSTRPRDRLWTPAAQADLLYAAFVRLGVERPLVVGHSMGTLVALALALDHPEAVSGLLLLSGYYYPSARVDAIMTAPVALPVLGDAMRYTTAALTGRALLDKLVAGMFAPKPVPPDFFSWLSREMMLRPVQLRANAEDAAFMIPAAAGCRKHYRELGDLPVTIIAGSKDVVVDPEAHSMRLHDELPHSDLRLIPGAGHMVHYAVPDRIADEVERMAPPQSIAKRVAAGM